MTTLHAVSNQRIYADRFFILTSLWALLLSIFHTWPMIDVRISAYFFSGPLCLGTTAAKPCGYFALNQVPSITALRWFLYALPFVAVAIIAGCLIAARVSHRFRDRLPIRRLWLSLASLALGTGLITNLVLKGHSGRPRPSGTDLFGGGNRFMPAGSFHGACQANCSFVSGEASGAGWLICVLILLPPRYRAWVAPPVILVSLSTAFLRVAVGAHYTSDVVLGWLLSIVIFAGLLALEEHFTGR
ncbi:phosphatase PAP2 family protein (plasmid) [Rhizobium grahamii]|uniref:Phosphatase PAP2 family protein n=1 Tax=Rhizobium grahamii TaxID=1120045 RepID=A0A5Q0CD01_9HYPH|nr:MULTISPECIES: phosphatase PAP2 family protein [Rhizobium]QFY63272.1 phosphatase PAP2 family protein [Rhizobium grahamii]QRM51964.1 phosphatase PAP2 family protein [Rhizobium sp. BG6]